jgi:hypothetical protein
MTDNSVTVGRDTRTEAMGTSFLTPQGDHAMGVELQIVELVEQQTRARVQHRFEDADRIETEIAQLRAELAATADFGLASF